MADPRMMLNVKRRLSHITGPMLHVDFAVLNEFHCGCLNRGENGEHKDFIAPSGRRHLRMSGYAQRYVQRKRAAERAILDGDPNKVSVDTRTNWAYAFAQEMTRPFCDANGYDEDSPEAVEFFNDSVCAVNVAFDTTHLPLCRCDKPTKEESQPQWGAINNEPEKNNMAALNTFFMRIKEKRDALLAIARERGFVELILRGDCKELVSGDKKKELLASFPKSLREFIERTMNDPDEYWKGVVDVGMGGNNKAGAPDMCLDSPLFVAEGCSVHPISQRTNLITRTDDFSRTGDGAAHMNVDSINSGLMARYFGVDINLLNANTPMWSPELRQDAMEQTLFDLTMLDEGKQRGARFSSMAPCYVRVRVVRGQQPFVPFGLLLAKLVREEADNTGKTVHEVSVDRLVEAIDENQRKWGVGEVLFDQTLASKECGFHYTPDGSLMDILAAMRGVTSCHLVTV